MKSKQKAHVFIGTSGFQYAEWRGSFYPDGMAKPKMLPYYAARLDTTEINYTFRSMPSQKTLDAWAAATPERFRFSLKAPQKITHFAKLRGCKETLEYFHQVTSNLGAKLGAVLFQLPPTFKCDVSLLSDFLADVPVGMKAALEFRHDSWFTDETYAALRNHGAALCIAESEDLATPVLKTADFTYFRLRRQDYTEPDIARWADQIRELVTPGEDSFVYFKHEDAGVGPKFAASLMNSCALSAR